MQKIVKKSPSVHHRTTLLGYILATKARIDNQKKKLGPHSSQRMQAFLLFMRICYCEPVPRCMHDYTIEFNMKWRQNQRGGSKVVLQAILHAH